MATILIIEDDHALAEGLTRALSTEQIQAENCSTLKRQKNCLPGMTMTLFYWTSTFPMEAVLNSILISTIIYRIRARKLYADLDRMLDHAMAGDLTETDFDESLYSALETKFHNYLTASETSANNVKKERARIKELISDISHQTKTPISNILLYTELLSEQELSSTVFRYEGCRCARCRKGR